MGISIEEMNTIQLDVLKEVGNIGAGNATTALAKMVNKKINMNVPKVEILEFQEVAELLGGAEIPVCGIYFTVDGDLTGNIMFLLSIGSSKTLADMLLCKNDKEGEFDDIDQSALKEIGNILSGAYISSLTGLTGLNMKISVPSLTIDMAGAILSVPIIQYGQVGDKVLLIETEFNEGEDNIRGFFFLIPDIDSYEVLLKTLGALE